VKKGISARSIKEEDLAEYYLVIGQAWAAISQKEENK